ncbi:MAG TPA: serine/threonine-protein kinase [Ktedonobacterales bacterium]|nr:serine/threonine-protein kinase [Ktedonobacterales bacterium]
MPQPPSHETLAPGTLLDGGRYRILEVIGTGGYASVYKAIDQQYGYERAIKEVIAPDDGAARQFRLEADVLVNIQSPNVPRGYNVFTNGRRIYFVMDFVQGKDLEELLNDSLVQRHRALDEAQTLQWAIEICDALTQLHSMPTPIIHRDIKPANIKITPQGHPVLIDFGLAKRQERAKQTQTAAQGVSPGFAPPEQYMAKGRTDARTDIYGVGATLYACLTGKDPAEAPARLLAQTGVSHGSPLDPPRKLNSHISSATERVILKALELAPAKRQQTARDLRDELRKALQALQPGITQASTQVMPPNLAPQPAKPDQQSAKRAAARPAASPPAPRPVAPVVPSPAGSGIMGQVVAAMAGQRTARQPVAKVDQRTEQQAAVAAAPQTTKQAAVGVEDTAQRRTLLKSHQEAAARSSGKHAAVSPQALAGAGRAQSPVLEAKDLNARALVGAAGAAAVATAVAEREGRASPSAKGAAVRPAAKPAAATPAIDQRAWIRFGETPLTTFGKWMLALAALETIWGFAALSLGIIALMNHGALPSSLMVRLAGGWLAVVALFALLGGQALTRPAYRRGRLNGMRRGLQGTGLFFFSVLVHAVALWGASIFTATQGDATLEVIAYTIFGINVLVAGVLALFTSLS